MKPLNMLSKIWKSFCKSDRPFSSSTWSGRLFFCTKIFEFAFAASRASRYQLASFWIWFYKSDFKNTCWASPKPNIQCKNHAERANFLREKRFSKIGVDSFNIASNRNYYFRFWRQEAEAFLPVFPWVSPKIHWKPEGMHTTQNCAVTVCKNAKDDCAETSSMIAQKCTPNQRNKSNLKDSHLIRTTDAHLTFGEWIKKYF